MNYIFQIEYGELSNNEKAIIDYLNLNPVAFYLSDIDEIAKTCYLSSSTISRLAKKLGFKSLKNLQFYVYHQHLISLEKNNQVTNKCSEQIFKFYNFSINETYNGLDFKKLNTLCEKIADASKVFLYGLGSSYLAADELGRNLQKLGLNTSFNYDFYNTLLSLVQTKEKMLLILFSKTARTKEILFLIEIAVEYEIDFVLVTANKHLKSKDENILTYEVLEQESRISSISSKVAQLFVCDLILNTIKINKLTAKNYARNKQILNKWNKFKF